jgi:hypothetical protein
MHQAVVRVHQARTHVDGKTTVYSDKQSRQRKAEQIKEKQSKAK